MTTKKPRYESRVFDGRIIHSAEIGRIHKEVLDFERIEAISEPMRADRGPVAGLGEQAPIFVTVQNCEPCTIVSS